jgi:hypothetical protein
MNAQASFTLRGCNPDVLTCIANLSSDEVFTPPEFASRILDTLAAAWAANHDGASIWADKTVKFLDPCMKSGVFLREITSRLTKGLEQEFPNLEELCNRVDLLNEQPILTEGTQMRRLRQDHWRMLGNGYCTRPDGVPCEYEMICESCPCFSTTVEFLPVLQKQKQDAEEKGQVQRVDIFTKLIKSMERS